MGFIFREISILAHLSMAGETGSAWKFFLKTSIIWETLRMICSMGRGFTSGTGISTFWACFKMGKGCLGTCSDQNSTILDSFWIARKWTVLVELSSRTGNNLLGNGYKAAVQASANWHKSLRIYLSATGSKVNAQATASTSLRTIPNKATGWKPSGKTPTSLAKWSSSMIMATYIKAA